MCNADRLAQRTFDLVSIPSESGREEAITDYIHSALMEVSPAYLKRHGSRLVATFGCEPDSASECLLLVGHMDTVPLAGHGSPEIDEDKILGLGTSDMKGALAVMLELARDSERGGLPFGLVFYDCEEVAFDRNGLRPLLEQEPWLGRAAGAILMEPTDNQVELGCMGTLHARVTFLGQAAHSARPWQGENAIHKAGVFLQKLSGLPERVVQKGPAIYREVVNATLASGGISRNVIPSEFTLNVNLRFPYDRTDQEAEAYVRSLAGQEPRVEIVDVAPAAPPSVEAPVLKRLAKDFQLELRGKQAWTDVAQFAQLGVPAVNFGPGVGAVAHKQNEYIPIENLVESFRILRSVLRLG